MADITLWKPEPDVVLHQALGKLAEECNELAKIASRCLIQGYIASDPKTGQHNYVQLREEMADVLAVMDWIVELRTDLMSDRSPRHQRKLDGFHEWQAMLRADAEARAKAPVGWRIVNSDGMTVMWDYDQKKVVSLRDRTYPLLRVVPMWPHGGEAVSHG